MAEQSYIDLAFGLSQLSGNQALYFKLLEQFSSEYQDIDEKIQSTLRETGVSDANILVHTIKGVAANLGLNRLHEQAKLVEHDLRQSQQLGEHYSDMVDCVANTISEIQTLTAQPAQPAQAVTKSNSLPEAHLRLKTVVTNMEFIAADDLEQLLAESQLPTAKCDAIRDAINDLDYFKAKSLLEN